MTTWSTNAITNDNRGAEASNVGTMVPLAAITISSITFKFTSSGGATVKCYTQQSDGTITQFGSDYTNNAAETHTFTGSQYLSATNFIAYVYCPGAIACQVAIQYESGTPVNGQEKSYYPKNISPTYASWTIPGCGSGYCAPYVIIEYSTGAPSSGTFLPPPPAYVRL